MQYDQKRFKIWEILRDAKEGERFKIINTNHSLPHWDNVVIRCVSFKRGKSFVYETAPNYLNKKKDECVALHGIVTDCYWEKIETVDDFYEFIKNKIENNPRYLLIDNNEIRSWFEKYFGGPIKKLNVETFDENEIGCDF